MKFRLVEDFVDDPIDYIDFEQEIQLGHKYDGVMDYFEFIDFITDKYSYNELFSILTREGYKLDPTNDPQIEVEDTFLNMDFYDFEKIPEFKQIMESEVYPRVAELLKDEEDFGNEFSYGIHGDL